MHFYIDKKSAVCEAGHVTRESSGPRPSLQHRFSGGGRLIDKRCRLRHVRLPQQQGPTSPRDFERPMSAPGLVSRVTPVHTAMRNCTRDEGRPFEFGNQVLISSHRKLLWSKAMVVGVAEKAGHDPVRQG